MTRILTLTILMAAVAVEASDVPLSISLVIPSRDGSPRIVVTAPRDHFHVVLRNSGSGPLRIWDTTFSWGYFALSLEFVGDDGAKHLIHKKQVAFTRNFPAAWLLEPQGYVVLDVFMADTTRWEGLPTVPSDCISGQLTAVYRVAPDPESVKQNVWTGRVVSASRSVSLCK
jgi:hypothetical protein